MRPGIFRKLCLLLAVAAFGLRVAGLSEKSVNIDEISTHDISRRLSWAAMGGRPPLSFVVISGALRIRDSQLMLLLPAALFGAATVGLIGWTGRVALGWRAGLVAGLWLLFSPLHVRYSQYARYYSFMIFFSLWSYLLLDLWLRMRRRRYLVVWLAASALNMTSHFFAAFVVALQGAVVVGVLVVRLFRATAREKRFRTAAFMLLALVVVVAGGWAAYSLTGLDDLVRSQLAGKRNWPTPGISFSWAFWEPYLGEMTGWPAAWLPAAFGLLAIGAGAAWQKNRLFLLHAAALLVVPIAVVNYIQPPHFFDIQYVSFALPFYVMGLALGAATVWEGAARLAARLLRGGQLLGAIGGAAALAAAVGGFFVLADRPMRREFRDLVRYVERLSPDGGLVLFTHPDDRSEFRYFASPKSPLTYRLCKSWAFVRSYCSGKRRLKPVWIVAGRLHRQSRRDVEWALNTFDHVAFEHTYLFWSVKHLEMRLDAEALSGVPWDLSREKLPPAVAGRRAFRLSLLVPRSGEYYVSLSREVLGSLLRFDSLRPTRWIFLTTDPAAKRSRVYLAEGRHRATLFAPPGAFERAGDVRLRMVPACGDRWEVNPSQFDIVKGFWNYDFPTTYKGRFGIEMRLWGQLSYPIIVERPGRYEFALTADNDRPTTNRVALWLNKSRIQRFDFNRCDNSLETKRAVIRLKRGFQVLSLQNEWYRGVDEVRRGPVRDLYKTTFLAGIRLRRIPEPDESFP